MAFRPTIIRNEATLIGVLRGRREGLGIGQAELDDRINWPDGYTAKAEAPMRRYGRRALWGLSDFLAYWLEALGLAMVIMDKREAEALVASSAEPAAEVGAHQPYAGRTRKREVVERRVLTISYSFPGGRKAA